MGKFKKSQLLILSLIVVLLSLTPFLSTSIRSTHLYIVINILILTVGVEAGLLSAFSKAPNEEKKQIAATTVLVPKNGVDSSTNVNSSTKTVNPLVKESNLEKKISTDVNASIFFISSGEIEEEEVVKYEKERGGDFGNFGDGDELLAEEEELSTKADTFISKFYEQLKMQKEES